MAYQPPQRIVDCTILTTAGFITAGLPILDKGLVLEQIDAVPEFYKLVNASIVGIETTVEFLALQRDAIVFWVPKGEDDAMLHAAFSPSQQGRVHVLFRGGVMSGDLTWREGVRLSDFVTRQNGYMLFRNCEITMGQGEPRKASAVIMNVNRMVGISTEAPI